VPYALVSFGSRRTRIAGMRSGINSSFSTKFQSVFDRNAFIMIRRMVVAMTRFGWVDH
jgi:hypothetical protein